MRHLQGNNVRASSKNLLSDMANNGLAESLRRARFVSMWNIFSRLYFFSRR